MNGKKLTSDGYNTDKGSLYLEIYNEYLGQLTDKNICLLELGIKDGGSLLMWRDYFSKGKIIGLDIKPVSINESMERIHIYTGLQQDSEIFSKMRNEVASDGFDIIIDDASHIGELTDLSFRCLFDSHLKPGGLYFIEDWRTGYWFKWPDGHKYTPRSKGLLSYLRRILDKKISRSIEKNNKNNTNLSFVDKVLFHVRNLISQKRFTSHNFGMVGFVKHLIDELGMDMITNPERGSKVPFRSSRFSFMNIYPGLIVIKKVKNP